MSKADKAVRISVRAHEDIEDWVSDDGPLVVIGEAAHPFPVCPLPAHTMPRQTLTFHLSARHDPSDRHGG